MTASLRAPVSPVIVDPMNTLLAWGLFQGLFQYDGSGGVPLGYQWGWRGATGVPMGVYGEAVLPLENDS